MKQFLASTGGKICIICLAVLLLAGAGLGGWALRNNLRQPRFQNVTIELGEPLPDISAFLTKYANPYWVEMVTPQEQIDLTYVGEQPLDFTHIIKTETVTLTITDTTAPEVTFRDVTVDIDTPLSAKDFVESIQDLSETTVDFVTPPSLPESYGDATVDVVVTDAHGNQTASQCHVYYVWLLPTFQLELGNQLTKADLLLNPEKDDALLDQAILDQINASPVGQYPIVSTAGELTNECVVTVVDTVAPTLKLRKVSIDSNQTAKLKDFIVSATDASGDVTTTLLTKLDCKTIGTQTVTVEAKDINGNVTTAQTTLQVSYDTTPPTFSGMEEMQVAKHSTPDYETGVSAWDSRDGDVSFTCDSGNVDTSNAGTYYAVYSATDSSGNTGTFRRKVTVSHGTEDTVALVASIAATLPSDAEKLRDYVRNNVYYSHGEDWGGDDPIWYGIKEKKGNCYVHALFFQALLREKGFETQLIWCVDKTHYWNLVKIDGKWYHMDSTPGRQHSRYSLMNDTQRLATLSGRDWDRTAWPVCE